MHLNLFLLTSFIVSKEGVALKYSVSIGKCFNIYSTTCFFFLGTFLCCIFKVFWERNWLKETENLHNQRFGWLVGGATVIFCIQKLNGPKPPFKSVESNLLYTSMLDWNSNPAIFIQWPAPYQRTWSKRGEGFRNCN